MSQQTTEGRIVKGNSIKKLKSNKHTPTKKKLVLLKTFYYRNKTQDGKNISNATNFVTNPPTDSRSSIRRMTDKTYIPIKNEYVLYHLIQIPASNSISGITDQIFQETLMIKTKCGFISANAFYFDSSSDFNTTIPNVDFLVTASSGDLKNAVQVTIEYDNDGTIFSNGAKFARRARVYGYK
jgi:hypothetical protein